MYIVCIHTSVQLNEAILSMVSVMAIYYLISIISPVSLIPPVEWYTQRILMACIPSSCSPHSVEVWNYHTV